MAWTVRRAARSGPTTRNVVWSAAVPWTRIRGGPLPLVKTAIGTPSAPSTWRGATPSGQLTPVSAADWRPPPRRGSRSPSGSPPAGRASASGRARRRGRRRGPPLSRRRSTRTRTRRAAPMTAGLSVTRGTCGSMCVGAGTASARLALPIAGEPGKTDSTWPSVPTPSSSRSKTGQSPLNGGPSARNVAASCSAHQSAPSPRPIASPVGKGWTFLAGSPTSTAPPAVPSSVRPIPSRMSSSGFTLESGWSRWTKRSSPHQTWTLCQGTWSWNGGCIRSRYNPSGDEPPVVAQSARPRARTAPARAVAVSSAAASGDGVRVGR